MGVQYRGSLSIQHEVSPMPLFSVRGRFANNFTFSVNPVDAADAKDALATVTNAEEVRTYGHPIAMITVKALGASKKKIHISDKPAAERKGGRKKKSETTAAAATPPAQPSNKKR